MRAIPMWIFAAIMAAALLAIPSAVMAQDVPASPAEAAPNEALAGVGTAIERALGSGAQDTSEPLSF